MFCKTFNSSCFIIKIAQPIIQPEVFKCKKNPIISFLTAITIFSFHLAVVSLIKRHMDEIATCQSLVCKQTNSMVMLWNLFILAIWYSLVFEKSTVENLFDEFFSLQYYYRKNLKKTVLLTNILTLLYIFFFIGDIIATTTIFYLNDELLNERYKTFNIIPTKKIIYPFIYVTLSRVLFVFLPGIIALLHVSLLIMIRQAIIICDESTEIFDTDKRVENFIQGYSKTHKVARNVEYIFNFAIMLMIPYQLARIFYLSLLFLERRPDEEVIFRIDYTIQYLQTSLCLLSVILAGNIRLKDETFREKIRELAFPLSLSKDTLIYSDIITRFADSKQVITFTVWKLFQIDRKLYLLTIVIFLMFSLVILNLSVIEQITQNILQHLVENFV